MALFTLGAAGLTIQPKLQLLVSAHTPAIAIDAANMDDKNRILIPIVVFNLVVVFYQLLFNSGAAFGWGKFFLAIALGTVAGGIAFAAMAFLKK